MLLTNLIRDGCRVKLGFPRVENRFLAQFSFADCSNSRKEVVSGVTGLEPEMEKARVFKPSCSCFLLTEEIKTQL